jgi:secondary thiamine-phosphate synthase enzyme
VGGLGRTTTSGLDCDARHCPLAIGFFLLIRAANRERVAHLLPIINFKENNMLITFPVRHNRSIEVCHRTLHLQTDEALQFIDLTAAIRQFVDDSNFLNGIINVQTRHTTTAIIVNENEPLLLEDLKKSLERLAPSTVSYRHDDFDIRTENLTPNERPNGHAHCKALFLRSSETINIINGELALGRWQRVFFIELDGARPRTISLSILGHQ